MLDHQWPIAMSDDQTTKRSDELRRLAAQAESGAEKTLDPDVERALRCGANRTGDHDLCPHTRLQRLHGSM